MRNLLRTDFVRMLRSKSFYIALIGLTAGTFFLVSVQGTDNAELPGLGIVNLLCSVAMFMVPVVVSGAVMSFIAAEFNGNAIRNKLIVGHSRTNVFLSWSAVSIAEAIVVSVIPLGLVSVALAMFADTSGLVAKNVLAAAGIFFCLLISRILLSVLLSILMQGSKALLFNYILTYALLVFFVITQEFAGDNKIISLLARCFPEGQMGRLSVDSMPDRPGLTMLCAVVFGLFCAVLGVCAFKKKDLS